MTTPPYVLEKLDNEPILMITVHDHFSIKEDLPNVITQVTHHFDEASEPLYYVNVAGNVKVSFGDMVSGLDMATRGDMGVLRHPKMKKFVAVAKNVLVQLSTKALGQRQYGNRPFAMYETLDEALAAIRAEIAAEKTAEHESS